MAHIFLSQVQPFVSTDGLPGVPCVLLEGEAKYCDVFVGDCVEQTLDDPVGKPTPLEVIDVYHLQ